MSYSDDLKSPLWQRKRLEIMERDQFQCQCCFDRNSPLVVHHKWYTKGFKPWEYDNFCYVILCEDCHDGFHKYWDGKDNNYFNQTTTYTDYFIFSYHYYKAFELNGINTLKQLDKMLISMIITEESI